MFSAGIALCVTLKYIAGEFIHAGEGLAIGFPHHLIIVVVKHFRGAGNRNRTEAEFGIPVTSQKGQQIVRGVETKLMLWSGIRFVHVYRLLDLGCLITAKIKLDDEVLPYDQQELNAIVHQWSNTPPENENFHPG